MVSVEIRAAFLARKVGEEGQEQLVYADDFVIKASPDGQEGTYTELELPEFEIHGGTEGWQPSNWREGFLEVDNLPENTRYLRIYFPPTAALGLKVSDTHLCKVAITTAQPPVQTLEARIEWAEEFYNAVCSGEVPAVYSYAKARALSEALTEAKAAGTTYDEVCTALDTLSAAQKAFADTVQGIPATFIDECASTEIDGMVSYGKLTVKIPGGFENLTNASGGQDEVGSKKGESVYSVGNPFGDYVFYEVDDTKTISNLVLEIARAAEGKNRLIGDMVIMAAPAAAFNGEYENVILADKTLGTSPKLDESMVTVLPYAKEQQADFVADKWERFRLTVPMLPKDTKYIFIGFPDMSTQKSHFMITSVRWAVLDGNSQFTAGDYTLKQTYANGKAAYTVTYTGTEAEKPVWLVAAAYKDGALEDISLTSAQCAQNVPQTLTAGEISSDADEVKILLWDGAALSPLTDLVEW